MKKVIKQKVSPSKAVLREIPPNASKTLHALREMGYDSFSSIMDIIDNSLDAGATKVAVKISQSGKDITIDILDNGCGMDEETLAQALRLGSDVEHDADDLGKFGMGLVTASISMARCVWVLTRQKDKTAYEANFDLDTIAREDRFVITLHPARSETVVKHLDSHGTLVRLSQIDRVSDTNVARFAATLRPRLGQVYREFIAKGVVISVNNRVVSRADPLMRDHELTEVVLDTVLDIGGGKHAKLVAVELPELGTAGDAEANIYPHNSGFYVVRNGREIMDAQTFGFYRHHHSYSHFRAELSFTGDLDTEFHVDIKKSIIHPNDKLLDKLRHKTARVIAESGRRGRDRSEDVVKLTHSVAEQQINALVAEPAEKKGKGKGEDQTPAPRVQFVEQDTGDAGRFFSVKADNGKLTLAYNTKHPLVRLVAEMRTKQSAALLDYFAFAMAQEEVRDPSVTKVFNRVCDNIKALLTRPKA